MLCISMHVNAQDIAILKYKGGGDWYSNPTAMSNLILSAIAISIHL